MPDLTLTAYENKASGGRSEEAAVCQPRPGCLSHSDPEGWLLLDCRLPPRREAVLALPAVSSRCGSPEGAGGACTGHPPYSSPPLPAASAVLTLCTTPRCQP